jgi:hypothetical protein
MIFIFFGVVTKSILIIGAMVEIEPLLIKRLNVFGQCPKLFCAMTQKN